MYKMNEEKENCYFKNFKKENGCVWIFPCSTRVIDTAHQLKIYPWQ